MDYQMVNNCRISVLILKLYQLTLCMSSSGMEPTTQACVLTRHQSLTSWFVGRCSTPEPHHLGIKYFLLIYVERFRLRFWKAEHQSLDYAYILFLSFIYSHLYFLSIPTKLRRSHMILYTAIDWVKYNSGAQKFIGLSKTTNTTEQKENLEMFMLNRDQ